MPPPPEWVLKEWNFFQAARWLGVAPWELAAQDSFWLERTKDFMSVEMGVRDALNARAKPRGKGR